MEMRELEQLGEQLRQLGHNRRETVEKIISQVEEGDRTSSVHFYQELSEISSRAISLMQRQKDMIDEEIQKLHQ
jgi:flagellar biosynthesis chaperone FliJ